MTALILKHIFLFLAADATPSSEHVLPLGQVNNADVYFTITNQNATGISCLGQVFATSEIRASAEQLVNFQMVSPLLQYITVNVPVANQFITLTVDDSDNDIGTHLRVLVSRSAYPTFATPLLDTCDQFFGRQVRRLSWVFLFLFLFLFFFFLFFFESDSFFFFFFFGRTR